MTTLSRRDVLRAGGLVGLGVAADDQFSLSVAVPTARFDAAFERTAAKALLEAVKALTE